MTKGTKSARLKARGREKTRTKNQANETFYYGL